MFYRIKLAWKILTQRSNTVIVIPLSFPWSLDYFGAVADEWTAFITQSEGMRAKDAPMILL